LIDNVLITYYEKVYYENYNILFKKNFNYNNNNINNCMYNNNNIISFNYLEKKEKSINIFHKKKKKLKLRKLKYIFDKKIIFNYLKYKHSNKKI